MPAQRIKGRLQARAKTMLAQRRRDVEGFSPTLQMSGGESLALRKLDSDFDPLLRMLAGWACVVPAQYYQNQTSIPGYHLINDHLKLNETYIHGN